VKSDGEDKGKRECSQERKRKDRRSENGEEKKVEWLRRLEAPEIELR
jgi:hypothetical protein